MKVPESQVELTYTYACSICGIELSTNYAIRETGEVPYPSLPRGWRYIMGELVCANHRVVAELRLLDYPPRTHIWRSGVEL